MRSVSGDLWQAYQATVFYSFQPVNYTHFAIITAWNPRSEKASDESNHQQNQALIAEFCGANYVTLLAGDEKKSWIEESFAVEISLQNALRLGRKFEQNAIYYVENNDLWLVSCEGERLNLGLFDHKLR